MAQLKNRALFFTTSPRTPSKMIPEIRVLHEYFSGSAWDKASQEGFIDKLSQTDFFEGSGSNKDKAFSARDRITRAPKALGFVNLKPKISLTDAGRAFVYGNRPQEVFLRQLMKFQLPSPYHQEISEVAGTFFIRPYLEIFRLIRELEYLTFDELKIFAIQLTDYRKFDETILSIKEFRKNKLKYKSQYKLFVKKVWTESIIKLYHDDIYRGNTKTRETTDASIKKFISTKQSNYRDYADACFRYLRYTGLVSIVHRSRSITFFPEKLNEVDYLLSSIEREPVYIDDESTFKAYLFSSSSPSLYVDNRDNLINSLMRLGGFTRQELSIYEIEELKDLQDQLSQKKKNAIIEEQVEEIKSYSLYSEIMDTYNEILTNDVFDAPLFLEYNTWRAMTMLDGGAIKGNFKFDDLGQPLSTAQGNMPDIECDYGDFVLSVEVTMQNGQRQYETEGEPVARHYGQMITRTNKEAYCLFIAPTINKAALSHFYALNQIPIHYYGGKSRIIPLELDLFMKLLDNAYTYTSRPEPKDVKHFLDDAISQILHCNNEFEWQEKIRACVNHWLAA